MIFFTDQFRPWLHGPKIEIEYQTIKYFNIEKFIQSINKQILHRPV